MTAVRIASTRGVNEYQASSYTIGTDAPTASFDWELRYNLLDQQSNPVTIKDIIRFLEGLENGFTSGKPFFSTAVTGTNFTGPQL